MGGGALIWAAWVMTNLMAVSYDIDIIDEQGLPCLEENGNFIKKLEHIKSR
jgi:hypothetical protein